VITRPSRNGCRGTGRERGSLGSSSPSSSSLPPPWGEVSGARGTALTLPPTAAQMDWDRAMEHSRVLARLPAPPRPRPLRLLPPRAYRREWHLHLQLQYLVLTPLEVSHDESSFMFLVVNHSYFEVGFGSVFFRPISCHMYHICFLTLWRTICLLLPGFFLPLYCMQTHWCEHLASYGGSHKNRQEELLFTTRNVTIGISGR
jgi:hypothetical protein